MIRPPSDEAFASLLYLLWQTPRDPAWETLSLDVKNQWLKVSLFVRNQELQLAQDLAYDSARKRWTERVLRRLAVKES